MIGLSLALATLSFRFIEVTGRRWLRRRLDVRHPVAAA
jgi:peptidoglycan/LPS O-acetylase OafA/YrhL